MVNFSADDAANTNPESAVGCRVLRKIIQQKIAAHPEQRITFAEFMDAALYHPKFGYYSTRARQIGTRGDFFTSPHLGAVFGQLLADQFVQMWDILGRPQPFTLVEMGAGQGLMARDILCWIQRSHPKCFSCLQYIIVEKAAGLIELQQQHLLAAVDDTLPIVWKSLEAIAENPVVGCFFSNELVDAFTVHQVVFQQGELYEVYVTLDQDQFVEILDVPSIPALESYFEGLGVRPVGPDYADPYRTEVNLAAQDWLTAVESALQQGYVVTIDYGYPAERYYNRVRSQGTLQCYYRHGRSNDPYVHVGEQDITAHVNFTALEKKGKSLGLENLGVTQQSMFLMALGIGDRIAALGRSESTDAHEVLQRLRQRDAMHQLINPMGLGNFGVLIQAKGLDPASRVRRLKGLDTPIAWNF